MIDEKTAQVIADAKDVLRRHGYYCIPREKVLKASARTTISDLQMMRMGDRDLSHFLQQQLRANGRALGEELVRIGALRIDRLANNLAKEMGEVDPTMTGLTYYQTDVYCLPKDLAIDPFLAMLREEETKLLKK